jgi:hypothetical protein
MVIIESPKLPNVEQSFRPHAGNGGALAWLRRVRCKQWIRLASASPHFCLAPLDADLPRSVIADELRRAAEILSPSHGVRFSIVDERMPIDLAADEPGGLSRSDEP